MADLRSTRVFGELTVMHNATVQGNLTVAGILEVASVTGKASSADVLATARTLTIGSSAKTFDGSSNVTWTLAEIGAAAATTSIVAGTGLTGGGTLAANRTLNVQYGNAANTAAQGNDSRINNGQTAFWWGNHASAGYVKTDTTYTAGNGLTLSGTAFSLPITVSGSGTYISDVVQTATGITVTKATPPDTNTTYAEITSAEVTAGTAATLRTITGRRLKEAVIAHGLAIGATASTAKAGNWVPSWDDVTGKPAVIAAGATQAAARTAIGAGTSDLGLGTAAGTAAAGNDSRINNGQAAFWWGNHASAGYVKTDTTYTAGAGLTLSGTAFSLPVTLSGSGTFVSSVTQTATGITVTLDTPPNTTYAEISEWEVNVGTAETLRSISGRRLKQAVDVHGLKIGTTATTAKAGNWTPSAAEIPTLNQNTTGSAASLTTARTLTIGSTGKTFNGSANVAWTLAEILPTGGTTSQFLRGDGTWQAVATGAPANMVTTDTAQTITGAKTFNGWVRTVGASGWLSQTYGGGVMMQDTTWVRIHGSKALMVSNQIASTGNITAYYSDVRLKENIKPIKSPLDKISKLNGVTYNANALGASFGYDRSKSEIGLLAHEVEAVIPQAVEIAPFDLGDEIGKSKSGENYLTLKYERIVPLLLEGIKELSSEVDILKSENQDLKSRLEHLEALILS